MLKTPSFRPFCHERISDYCLVSVAHFVGLSRGQVSRPTKALSPHHGDITEYHLPSPTWHPLAHHSLISATVYPPFVEISTVLFFKKQFPAKYPVLYGLSRYSPNTNPVHAPFPHIQLNCAHAIQQSSNEYAIMERVSPPARSELQVSSKSAR